MTNREHKAYPNIRETPFYLPGARLAAFFAMDGQFSVPRDVQRYSTDECQTLTLPQTHLTMCNLRSRYCGLFLEGISLR